MTEDSAGPRLRRFVLVAGCCVGLALAALSGCGGRHEPAIPVLSLATWFGTREAGEMQRIVDGVNARHAKEFRLKMLTIPDAFLTKVDTMMAGGMAPDLFVLNGEYLASYASIGAVADLDARIRADRSIDLADYYPAALEASTWNGRFYSLPWVMMPIVLYYNRDLFDAARQPYPDATWDWARFLAAARALTHRDPAGRASQWGFVQYTWPPYFMWLWQNGADLLAAGGRRPALGTPAAVEALEFLQRLVVTEGASPSPASITQLGVNELFKSGRVAMFYGGSSDDHDRTPGLRVGVAEVPRGKHRATFCWLGHLVISAQCPRPDLAYTAWRELLEGFHHWKIVAPRRSLARRLAELEPRKAQAREVILASMEYARGFSGVVEQTDWDSFVKAQLLDPLFRGQVPAASAAATVQAKLERLLEASP